MASFMKPKETKAIGTLNHQLQWMQDKLPREAWILNETDLVGNQLDVVWSVQTAAACAISDGWFMDHQGAAGFS
jgi:hypothetical protein